MPPSDLDSARTARRVAMAHASAGVPVRQIGERLARAGFDDETIGYVLPRLVGEMTDRLHHKARSLLYFGAAVGAGGILVTLVTMIAGAVTGQGFVAATGAFFTGGAMTIGGFRIRRRATALEAEGKALHAAGTATGKEDKPWPRTT